MTDWTRQFEGGFSIRPPVDDQHLASLPARSGLALLLAEGGRPIALLPGADLRSRIRNRMRAPEADPRRLANLQAVTQTILWRRTWSHFETDWRFLEIARQLWPKRYTDLLACKPAWFVHVNPAEQAPHFARTRDLAGATGVCLGPFPNGRSADRFIEVLQDAFDLCRRVQCLRQAPHGSPCAYAQIGKCRGVCDGATPMDEYRQVVERAAAFAAGRRADVLEAWRRQMKRAAADLAFERAAKLKARIERAAELNAEAYRHVAPAGAFRYIVLQPGRSRRRACMFLVRGGSIVEQRPARFPPQERQLEALLGRAGAFMQRDEPMDEAGPWRLGLAARYLFSSPERRGVMLRWREDLSAGELAETIRQSAKVLNLREPKPRSGGGKGGGPARRAPKPAPEEGG